VIPDKKQKTALITGITGQDGAYLSRLLLSKNYNVHGLQRRTSLPNTDRIHPLIGHGITLHHGDITDTSSLLRIISEIQPDEIYNLAAQSHVHVSFDAPEYTANADGIGATRILESIRILGLSQTTKFLQASTSELFGKVKSSPQNEDTPFYPRSPYAAAKLYAYWMTVNYREAYGMFAANAIMFNHESPLRGEEFVTRKITKAVAKISLGQQDCLCLGNLDARRDWGHANDYMAGAWSILQHDIPDNFVLASGVSHTVRELVSAAFEICDIQIDWQGHGRDEVGVNKSKGNIIVRVDPTHFRPTEVDMLLGDATKAKQCLGWTPRVSFEDLIREMVQSDLKMAEENR
jgi:GDPmannose 4,6-dehydratase